MASVVCCQHLSILGTLYSFYHRFSTFEYNLLTMKNVLLTTLAVFLITVTLVGQVQCVLRAGRDNIMIPRKGVREELEIMHNQAKPVYAKKSGYRRARPLGNENEVRERAGKNQMENSSKSS
ncbi:hypothetical protein pdam_00002255 [Pocillopora damicornis]|uniref:Uncharacterized protein n=1 Tax=Pocillopora damicornis TaxID=46731 RepID=A0A3M6TFD7_POCDA|nr:hypothetical protein pdam_00002255 [Pocillopora damicornis]